MISLAFHQMEKVKEKARIFKTVHLKNQKKTERSNNPPIRNQIKRKKK